MAIKIAYGHISEELDFPESQKVYLGTSPAAIEPVKDAEAAIWESLQNPIGSPKISELAKGAKKVVILISDYTRPTPSHLIIPQILKELQSVGVEKEKVVVIGATGLHAPCEQKDFEKILGLDLCSQLKTVAHNPDDKENLVYVGETSHGTPVIVNKEVVDADLVISLSTIEPHLFYGWSGGAKNVIPGISARETVNFHHGRFGKYITGLNVIKNNIHREDAEEAGKMIGLKFICNVVLNEKREIVGVFSGDAVDAHRAGVQLGQKLNVITIPEMADIVISALGGSPRDSDFWQAEGKALMHSKHMLKDNGVFILVSGCEKGIGGKVYADLLLQKPETIKELFLSSDFSLPLMKANDLCQCSEQFHLFLVCPGIKPEDLPHFNVKFFDSIAEAYEAAQEIVKPQPVTLVIPDASRVVITLEN